MQKKDKYYGVRGHERSMGTPLHNFLEVFDTKEQRDKAFSEIDGLPRYSSVEKVIVKVEKE